MRDLSSGQGRDGHGGWRRRGDEGVSGEEGGHCLAMVIEPVRLGLRTVIAGGGR